MDEVFKMCPSLPRSVLDDAYRVEIVRVVKDRRGEYQDRILVHSRDLGSRADRSSVTTYFAKN